MANAQVTNAFAGVNGKTLRILESDVINNGQVGHRLTTQSTVPVTTADRTAQSSIFFSPLNSNVTALYTGSYWAYIAFSEITLALSGLTSGKNYDVFCDYNGGTPQLVLSVAWTDDVTRSGALVLQDGVYVKSGSPTLRYIGTIRTTGTTTTEDSAAKRYVWNAYNRLDRTMANATETTDSWNYTTATFRQANANAANQLDYVVGLSLDMIEATVRGGASNASNVGVALGIGVDSTSANSALLHGQIALSAGNYFSTQYRGYPGIGRHYLAWLEYSAATGTTTWYGDNGNPTIYQSGISGVVRG